MRLQRAFQNKTSPLPQERTLTTSKSTCLEINSSSNATKLPREHSWKSNCLSDSSRERKEFKTFITGTRRWEMEIARCGSVNIIRLWWKFDVHTANKRRKASSKQMMCGRRGKSIYIFNYCHFILVFVRNKSTVADCLAWRGGKTFPLSASSINQKLRLPIHTHDSKMWLKQSVCNSNSIRKAENSPEINNNLSIIWLFKSNNNFRHKSLSARHNRQESVAHYWFADFVRFLRCPETNVPREGEGEWGEHFDAAQSRPIIIMALFSCIACPLRRCPRESAERL